MPAVRSSVTFPAKSGTVFPQASRATTATAGLIEFPAMIAVGCGAVMALAGLNNAVFWAFLIFIAVYIPVLGGLIAGILPPLFAYLQFGDVMDTDFLIECLERNAAGKAAQAAE